MLLTEGGNWCKKYKSFIDDRTVKQCKEERNMHPKRCPNCKHYSYAIIYETETKKEIRIYDK